MTHTKLLILPLIAVALFLGLSGIVVAQSDIPPPYAGIRNPFSWSDVSIQAAGKPLYQQFCAGCHGVKGNSIPASDFSASAYPGNMENQPDYYFWIFSEGRLEKGMPPFKSSLSEDQRWQVLTYLWSLGNGTSNTVTMQSVSLPKAEDLTFRLEAPEEAQVGESLLISASLIDKDGRPVANVPVKFFLKVDFFASGMAEIDEVFTNSQGIASVAFAPYVTGEVMLMATHKTGEGERVEALWTIRLKGDPARFHESKVGLPGGVGPPDLVLAPVADPRTKELGIAPPKILRIPGGLAFFPFTAYLAAVILVWGLYIRIMYQVVCIPLVVETDEVNTRLLPVAGVITIALTLALLVMILIAGPDSHPHLSFG